MRLASLNGFGGTGARLIARRRRNRFSPHYARGSIRTLQQDNLLQYRFVLCIRYRCWPTSRRREWFLRALQIGRAVSTRASEQAEQQDAAS